MFCGACNIGRKNENNSKNGGKGKQSYTIEMFLYYLSCGKSSNLKGTVLKVYLIISKVSSK